MTSPETGRSDQKPFVSGSSPRCSTNCLTITVALSTVLALLEAHLGGFDLPVNVAVQAQKHYIPRLLIRALC